MKTKAKTNRLNLLAIEASGSVCSLAIEIKGRRYERCSTAFRQLAEVFLPTMQNILSDASCTLSDLEAIAFSNGPGSFTGLRIIASLVQGLAYGAGLKIKPVSSLALMAQSAYREFKFPRYLIAQDARMQQVYFAAYEFNAEGEINKLSQEGVYTLDKLPTPFGDFIKIGDGWPSVEKAKQIIPEAQDVLALAKNIESLSPEFAQPVYLKESYACCHSLSA